MEREQAGGGSRAGGGNTVTLLTRAGCSMCERAARQLAVLREELDFELVTTDVDEAVAAGDASLRARYGDLLPVVLLNGTEHSYWDVDEQQLRADLSTR
ncbi:glutaredoxin family protein [Mycolicibacterium sp. 050232]|uniref:glutaredoxin family protein n=1 Tax=Mycolicibacterium sp. 050232 TaxID=3113982 RepID=UPI002E2E7A3B|nr:glutaredoxin family protein [Mycolicibacterium sp. 050232]MED5815095.1 glutaredoxin family protein [Mycolicibacterium sp. 050232]